MGTKTMRQNILEDFEWFFLVFVTFEPGSLQARKKWPKNYKILFGHTHVKPRGWKLHPDSGDAEVWTWWVS